MKIDRQVATSMRGLAIIFIALHNYLHGEHGFINENEMSFQIERTNAYFSHISTESFLYCVGDFLSFLGWIGVPVFVFFTGFGLIKRYKDGIINTKQYVKYCYLKLFFLMLPAVVFYSIYWGLSKEWIEVVNSITSLSLLGNLHQHILPMNPGIYWYFGLTFQLYIFFLLLKKCNMLKVKHYCILFILGGAFLMISYYISNSLLSFLRHNFVGWLSVFAFGLFISDIDFKKADYALPAYLLPILGCILLMLIGIMNYNFFSWIFVPFLAIAFFFVFAKICVAVPLLKQVSLWLGKYSAFIFVTHPMARAIFRRIFSEYSLTTNVIVYLIAFCIFSIIYKMLYERLKSYAKI